ncbi:hypothetical protein BCR43DRAFT_455892 [Syncephalastrum racemosum]|uniref:Rho-GAP domain-containing protein n=1 Tax=Syncephalastrum racemosum TaxID=13706 RepID=A0A1X2HJS5_SYNRA|nr:hypothetical protein BCR43DRAFT_455892 [Syncephalastrum racemosum]
MPPLLHFDTAFWSQKQPETHVPDFQTGLQVLHSKLNQSKVENEEVLQFVKDRIAAEESFASRLSDQSKTKLRSSGFQRDEGAGLKACFEHLRVSSGRFANQHKQTASQMTKTVLQPLQKHHDEYKRSILVSKQSVDAALKQFDALVKEVDRARTNYVKKCHDAVAAEDAHIQQLQQQQEQSEQQHQQETFDDTASGPTPPPKEDKPSEEKTVVLGHQTISQTELDALVTQMQSEINIGDHRVPILGKYPNTSTGEDISRWLQHHLPQCKDSPAMADVVGQQLIHPLGILRLVGQRGSRFMPSAQSFYQWRQLPINNGNNNAQHEDDDTASSTTGNNGSALGGLLERFGGTMSSANNATNEDIVKKAERDANVADETYRTAIGRLDQMRTVVEQTLFAHFAEMEQVELRRLATLKQVLWAFSVCLSDTLPGEKAIVDEMLVYQESLKPEQDIQYIVQQYCVAAFAPKPILYDHYKRGTAYDQTFGVSLDLLGAQTESDVPKFVQLALAAIEQRAQDIQDTQSKQRLWSTKLPLDRVHAARMELNLPVAQLTPERLAPYDALMIVAVLRLFFMELPECLLTYEFYDAAQTLYSSHEQDESLRVLSLSNLVATLPGAHFATLRAMVTHIKQLVPQLDSEEVLLATSQSVGPVILRPRTESLATLTSRIPERFARDLLIHTDTLFSEGVLKSHAESEKRRQAKPLVAQNTTPASPTTKRSLMSFMQEDKWGVNSVMGVFQRQSPQQTQTNTTSSHTNSMDRTPSSASSSRPKRVSAITQDSPPLVAQSIQQEPEPEVVFDLKDHVTGKKNKAESDASAAAGAAENDQHDVKKDDDLDPFFADEED